MKCLIYDIVINEMSFYEIFSMKCPKVVQMYVLQSTKPVFTEMYTSFSSAQQNFTLHLQTKMFLEIKTA